MIIPIVCFVGGLVAMGRTKPQTGVRKLLCLGPRSGLVYPVEDFPEVGTVVVRAPNKAAVVQFLRISVREPGKPGLVFMNASGDPRLVDLIRKDFGAEPKPLAVVPNAPAKSEGSRPATATETSSMPPAPDGYEWHRVGGTDTAPSLIAVKKTPEAPAAAAPKAQKTGRSTP